MPPKKFVRAIRMDAKSFHEIIVRNGIFLPPLGGFCKVDYITKVKNKEIDCPTFKEIRVEPCPVMPMKEDIVKELKIVEQELGKNFGFEGSTSLPPKLWLITLLSTYKPDHRFFAKDFYPRDRRQPQVMNNMDGTFTNLPSHLLQDTSRRGNITNRFS
jgi:hypothetical protein